jgi:8-oxo-dGTP pyrophosphatase MutT (NUDIX family)
MSDYMRSLRASVGPRLLQVPSVSIVVRDDKDRVLLVRHENDGRWVLPGGAVEPAEIPAEAAVREMWEETGLFVEPTRVLGVYGGAEFIVDYRNGDRTSYMMAVFQARRVSGTARPDHVETLDLRYFSFDEARTVNSPDWLDEVLEDVFAGNDMTAYRRPSWTPPSAV